MADTPPRKRRASSTRKRTSEPVWPHNRKKKTVRPQDHDDPQPRAPEGRTQRGGKQTAEELKHPPTRTGRNGGTLRTGGTNKGGKGATPSVLRQRCRDTLARNRVFNVPLKVIRNPASQEKDKLKAWALLAQFGGLAALSLTDNDGNALELPAFVVQQMKSAGETSGALPPADDGALADDETMQDGETW